jgi:flavodoxin
MSVLIIHDSIFGNTAQIARAISEALGANHNVRMVGCAPGLTPDLADVELLIVGSPTRGFRPTPGMQECISRLDGDQLVGLRAAAFDTRLDLETIHPIPLRWVVGAGGYAADVLARQLRERGCVMAGEPGGFLVSGTEGPLKPGETDRARSWAAGLETTLAPALAATG